MGVSQLGCFGGATDTQKSAVNKRAELSGRGLAVSLASLSSAIQMKKVDFSVPRRVDP